MAHPIMNASGTLLGIEKNSINKCFVFCFYIGVVEFYRIDNNKIPFSNEDEEVCHLLHD